jgi:hypothetical protein
MVAPVWTSGDVSLELAQESDWPMLRSVHYGFTYDSEPASPSAETSVWWRHLWGMVVIARHREQFLGYIRNGYSSPGDLLTRLQAGVVRLTDEGACATAVGLYLRLLLWHMPVNRVHVEVPSTPEAEDFAAILCQAGFQREGRYPRHLRVGGSVRDVVALGFLRRDVEVSPAG